MNLGVANDFGKKERGILKHLDQEIGSGKYGGDWPKLGVRPMILVHFLELIDPQK